MKQSHNSYCFFAILSLITDYFRASLMVMFRILFLKSCHFEAWGFFPCLQTNCSARLSPLLHLFSELFPRLFFLIQRPCSSCSTIRLRLLLSTSSYLSIPFDGCIKFIRNVTRVTIAYSKQMKDCFDSRG